MTSGPFQFCVGTRRLSKREREVFVRLAYEHDVHFVEIKTPYEGTGQRWWFETKGPGQGAPFDSAVASAVRAALAEIEDER